MSDRDTRINPRTQWMTPMRLFLAALTTIGFLAPNAMVIAYFSREGVGQADYFRAWTASLPSTQLLVDLTIVAIAFLGWALAEARRLRITPW